MASSVSPGFCAPKSSKKWCEKKCTWASATSRGPQGDCRAMRWSVTGSLMGADSALIGRQRVKAARQRDLCQARHIIDAQLLHHGLAVTADGLFAKVEEVGDFLTGLALGHHAQH